MVGTSLFTGTFESSPLFNGTFESSFFTGTFELSPLFTGTFESSDVLTGTLELRGTTFFVNVGLNSFGITLIGIYVWSPFLIVSITPSFLGLTN